MHSLFVNLWNYQTVVDKAFFFLRRLVLPIVHNDINVLKTSMVKGSSVLFNYFFFIVIRYWSHLRNSRSFFVLVMPMMVLTKMLFQISARPFTWTRMTFWSSGIQCSYRFLYMSLASGERHVTKFCSFHFCSLFWEVLGSCSMLTSYQKTMENLNFLSQLYPIILGLVLIYWFHISRHKSLLKPSP